MPRITKESRRVWKRIVITSFLKGDLRWKSREQRTKRNQQIIIRHASPVTGCSTSAETVVMERQLYALTAEQNIDQREGG